MKSYLKIFIPFVLAVLLGSLTVIFAQTKDGTDQPGTTGNNAGRNFPPPPPGFGGPRGGIPPQVLEQLDLTEDQISKISKIRENAHESEKTFFDKMRASDDKLRDISKSGNAFDEAQARQALTARSQVMVEVELVHMRAEAQINALLTPDQLAQAETLKQQHAGIGRRMPPPDGFRPPPPASQDN
jgi:Spy/CpxP family protein refolding chaperone